MSIVEPKYRSEFQNQHVQKLYTQFEQLITEIRRRSVPDSITDAINQYIQQLNAVTDNGDILRKTTRQKQTLILKLLDKELKIVPRHYYRTLWTALGMTAFGLPIGVAIGLSLGNIGLLAIGLPIGMAIGLAVGTSMDKKALAEGRTLDIVIR